MSEYGVALNFDDHERAYATAAQRAPSNGKVVELPEAPNKEAVTGDWPEPLALGGELPSVADFDRHLMPTAFMPLIEDTAERMQVPFDYPAAITVLSLAGVT